MDKRRIDDVIHAVTDSRADCELSIAYKIKDPGAVGRELLEKCVQDIRSKAEILTARQDASSETFCPLTTAMERSGSMIWKTVP